MGKIVLLDELTINQIAAGEVIERPASVVKEMVENSIDAGAKNINVEIKNGGISYIRVIDDGKGILPDDMEIAFERHATSKIKAAEDLKTVKSMGFRGEALASIASIANVEMVSRTEDIPIGNKIIVEAGNVLEKSEIGAPVGTMITVTNLFFNTPVRYKFLKKDFTEAGYIEDAIKRIALVNPGVSLKLINSGKTIIQTPGNGNLKDTIYSIYGKDIANEALDVNYDYEDVRIKGVVGKPGIARSNRSNQLFFVNNRYIKDKTLSSAVEKAFKGLLPIGKYAFLILNIEIDPSMVDVNVHPAKLEVRFQEEQKIFKAVYHAIKETLLKNDLVMDTERDKKDESESFKFQPTSLYRNRDISIPKIENKDGQPTPMATLDKLIELQKQIQNEFNIKPENKNDEKNDTSENEIKNDTFEKNVSEDIQKVEIENESKNIDNTNKIEDTKDEETESKNVENIKEKNENLEKNIFQKLDELKNMKLEQTVDFNQMYEKTFGTSIKKDETEEKVDSYEELKPVEENMSLFEEKHEYNIKPEYKFIGIVFKTYIIIEIKNEIYIIDQHAAHERVLYEKVKKNFYEEKDKDSQLMILPDIINLSHKEMDIVKDNTELFEKAGFIIEEFGENTIKLSGTPSILIDLDTKELFLEILDEINTVARTAKQEIEDRFLATIACKAAVKAGMDLSQEEVDELINQLLTLENPFACPHGRPTTIKMSKYDLERKFSRK